ncbi:hypothetical protein TNCV_4585281 [Trichonephila clavipes]|nr:hypothetical protein TNCV_4585281 [Trichonephila clavipes]
MRNLPFRRTQRPKSNKIIPCKTISGHPAVSTGEGIKLPCVFEAVREIYRNILATASFEKVDHFRSEIQLAGHPLRGLKLFSLDLTSVFQEFDEHFRVLKSCTVEAEAVFNMFAIAAISSRQTIVNKYLQNNKGVNWNGLAVDDFVVVACVAGSVVEACVVHQS